MAVCGSGNNGGDGIAIARLLHLSGIHTEIFLAGNPDKMTEESQTPVKLPPAIRCR
ncbi:MAG: NAD(P)H-hydrate epimerase [Ruminococcus sp.]